MEKAILQMLMQQIIKVKFLINSHIPAYKGPVNNHNPRDIRKLLLNKREINKVIGKINREGLTVIPTKIYFKKGKQKSKLQLQKEKTF